MVEVVRCNLRGKFAHFRRFYTNSSSLSYPFPPPTVIRGIIGAALGLERHEYLERLGDLSFALAVCQPVRSIFQSINALMVKSATERELRGFEERTQIPTQFFLAETRGNESEGTLCYHIVLIPPQGFTAQQLAAAFRRPVYPPALGVAYCLGWFEDVRVEQGKLGGESPDLHDYFGVLRAELVDELDLGSVAPRRISRDRYPIRLDGRRQLQEAGDLLVDLLGHPIRCRYRGPWIQLGAERWALIS